MWTITPAMWKTHRLATESTGLEKGEGEVIKN